MNPRCQTTRTFHFPLRTLMVPCTGQPKLVFIERSGITKLCVLPAGVNRVIPFRCESVLAGDAEARVSESNQGNDRWENEHDSGNGRQRKRRKNCFAGGGKERSEASRDVSIGGGSGESSCGNGNGDRGLCETGNVERCVEGRGDRVF